MALNESLCENIQANINRRACQDKLIRNNIKFVTKIANGYKGFCEGEDAVQEGCMALLEAANRYNPEYGTFLSYAAYWIKAYIVRYIKTSGFCIRLPEHTFEKVVKLKRFITNWQAAHSRSPTDTEICQALQWKPEALERVRIAAQVVAVVSLEEPTTEDGLTLGDTIADPRNLIEDATERIQQEQLGRVIWAEVASLGERPAAVLKCRYKRNMTLEQTGKYCGITAERVRQLAKESIRKLKDPKHAKNLQPFLESVRTHAMRGVDVNTFRRTWTSATEREAFYLLARNERTNSENNTE